jgi:5-(carboxyamino)imidazole ribonucleotide synthase
MIFPDAMLGMLGGGQLGRMFTLAAHSMGYRVTVLDPDPLSPAGAIADVHLKAAYQDVEALQQLADTCAAVTTEFENVPAESLRWLASHCAVRPAGDAVAIAQDRIREKAFVRSCGIEVAPYAVIEKAAVDPLSCVTDPAAKTYVLPGNRDVPAQWVVALHTLNGVKTVTVFNATTCAIEWQLPAGE